MRISTGYYRFPEGLYIRVGFFNALREQWYISFVLFFLIGLSIYFRDSICIVICCIIEVLYLLFWVVQFYGITKLPQMKIMFQRIFFEFNDDQILMHVDTRSAAQIKWGMIKSCRKMKDCYFFFITKANILYVPFKAFKSKSDLNLFEVLLKVKNVIK